MPPLGSALTVIILMSPAQEWAGNGSMVGAIAGSTQREPITVGKPAEFMLDNIAKTFNLQRQQICMVGDRLDTDILFGKNGGLTTCLVLSGEWWVWVCGGVGVGRGSAGSNVAENTRRLCAQV
jgi:phosphoglycolate phosphatase-like HAD superfamily hydrolase